MAIAEYDACDRGLSIPLETKSAEYDAYDRGLSIPLETKSTVEPENCQNMEDFLTFMKHISRMCSNMFNDEFNRKELLSVMKSEIEHFVQSTDINVLQEYLHTIIQNDWEFMINPICFFFLIAYHVLVASERRNIIQILNVMKGCPGRLKSRCMNFCQLYLDMYYKDNLNEIFTNIHTIWKLDPISEFCLKLAYCENLMGAKDYKTLIQLIHHHADYFIESFELIKEHPFFDYSFNDMFINVLIHILHHQASLNMMEKEKTVETIILRMLNKGQFSMHYVFNKYIIPTIDNKEILGDPHIVKLIQHAMKKHPKDCANILILCSSALMQANHYSKKMKFNKCFSQLILSLTTNEHLKDIGCYPRNQYCMSLLILLDSYVSCHDTCKMNLVLMRLLELRVSLLSPIEIIYRFPCYCFMGEQKKNCMTRGGVPVYDLQIQKGVESFQRLFSNNNKGIILSNNNPLVTLDSVNENILWGKEELALYLQRIKDMMEMKEDARLEELSFLFFMKIIKRTNNHNEFKLYDIIKILCTFDLQPEIQDIILSGLTEYLIISCNRQYGMLSKFILDINMICSKGQFLQKLTSSITKVWLKFNDDTVNDIKRVIYHCYCTVRHSSKNEKDANIEKYKDHYTFIATMEVEEEMEKLKNLTNVLLMLTLLLIASGGHHKSAELKKYLSLKYEYRDSILYLLWCSGDVEINPGPTLSTLRKVPDSVKERNWIYDMCSILVTLIKYKSFDNKNGGMWKEKPLHWPTDCLFYDPRNKPKGQGYNIDTDKKLLECLEEHCNREEVFKETTQFDDEHTKLKVKQYQKEIIAWKNKKTELYEPDIIRKELDTLIAAKGCLHKYSKDLEFHLHLYNIHELIFFSEEVSNGCKKSYTDIVKDIATTFGRIAKKLNYLEKSPGIWITEPAKWNPSHLYPDQSKNRRKLVDNLLTYCESKEDIKIPPELQPLVKAWKQRNTSDITKYYIIWSKTAIINHSLKYLELQGILDKKEVQERLQQIGIKLDTQYWKCPSLQKVTYTDNDDKSQDSSFSDSSHSSPCTVNTTENITNSSQKVLSFPTINDNQLMKLTNSTNANLNAACDSSYCYDSHAHDHLCDTKFNLDHEWNQSSKHTCVSSCKDSFSILTQRSQPEADDKHHPISPVNFSNSKYQLISSESNLNEQLIPSTVYIHEDTSKPERKSNNISKTAKKRHRQNNGESCSEPKRLHVSEEDLPLPVDSSSYTQADNENKKGETTSDQWVNHIVNLLEEIEQDYSATAVEPSSGQTSSHRSSNGEIDNAVKNIQTTSDLDFNVKVMINLLEELDPDYISDTFETHQLSTCSLTDRSSDYSDELPDHVESIIDELLNSNDTNNTFDLMNGS